MQRWEYLTVQLGDFREGHGSVIPRFVSGQALVNYTPIGEYVSQLGQDGWEMTGAISIASRSEHFLFFKRMLFDIIPGVMVP